jgi:hypothetical protein
LLDALGLCARFIVFQPIECAGPMIVPLFWSSDN